MLPSTKLKRVCKRFLIIGADDLAYGNMNLLQDSPYLQRIVAEHAINETGSFLVTP